MLAKVRNVLHVYQFTVGARIFDQSIVILFIAFFLVVGSTHPVIFAIRNKSAADINCEESWFLRKPNVSGYFVVVLEHLDFFLTTVEVIRQIVVLIGFVV